MTQIKTPELSLWRFLLDDFRGVYFSVNKYAMIFLYSSRKFLGSSSFELMTYLPFTTNVGTLLT